MYQRQAFSKVWGRWILSVEEATRAGSSTAYIASRLGPKTHLTLLYCTALITFQQTARSIFHDFRCSSWYVPNDFASPLNRRGQSKYGQAFMLVRAVWNVQ
jgi:hypothetical protein